MEASLLYRNAEFGTSVLHWNRSDGKHLDELSVNTFAGFMTLVGLAIWFVIVVYLYYVAFSTAWRSRPDSAGAKLTNFVIALFTPIGYLALHAQPKR